MTIREIQSKTFAILLLVMAFFVTGPALRASAFLYSTGKSFFTRGPESTF